MAIDATAALRKLQSGQALTAEEKVALGIGPAVAPNTTETIVESDPNSPEYYTKKDSQGKTQAQRDAAKNAIATAGIIRENTNTQSAYVDPGTGKVVLTGVKTPTKITNPTGPTGPTNPTQIYTATDGKTFTDAQAYATYQASLNAAASNKAALDAQTKAAAEQAQANRQSAYDLLLQQFSQYGLSALVEPLKELITSNISPSEFALRLQQTDAYKKRFAANQDRINKGLRALTPAEYIGLEDQYQNIMRNYGLPASYYTKDSMGTQEGFNKFLANDVSAAELEDRIATAQKRVLNTNPEVLQALKQFYPDLNNADILAYTLDPSKALEEIKRKVTAAEIGGAALAQGLQAQGGTAEALAGYGITKAQAQQGYQTIGEFLPTAQKLGEIYQNQGLGAYDQSTAEREVFGTQGAATAAQKRRKLAQLEQATFGGQAGTSQGALDRGRQGSF